MQMDVTTEIRFSRKRAVIWACDIEKSSSILNDLECIEAAEEFLKRFFYISSILSRLTGAVVKKWTGDGFLFAYEISLDRDLGAQASKVLLSAYHLTLLINVTQLSVKCPKKFKLRHAVTYEPDAILIEHQDDEVKGIDIIGRAAVLAFRLLGITAAFPNVVTHKNLLETVPEADRKASYRKLRFSHGDVLKYFKGEKWATKEIYASADRMRRRTIKSKTAVVRHATKVIKSIENPENPLKQPWLNKFYVELMNGPTWAKETMNELSRYYEEDLIGSIKAMIRLIQEAPQPLKGNPS